MTIDKYAASRYSKTPASSQSPFIIGQLFYTMDYLRLQMWADKPKLYVYFFAIN